MQLLDIIVDYPRRSTDTLRRVKEVLPDTVKEVLPDTVHVPAKPVSTDSLMQFADVAPRPPMDLEFGNDDLSTILWVLCAILAALSLCFYFVTKYRKQQSKS